MKLASPHQISPNPNLIKSKFTKTFLRSFLKISRETPTDIFERCDKVKTAADKSLASAVGSRRAWSRAILSKIRRHHYTRRRRWWHRRPGPINKRRCCLNKGDRFDEAKKLRKVVPGGEAMDLYSLLDEAAHYVMCLNTQVQAMTSIADFCSSTA